MEMKTYSLSVFTPEGTITLEVCQMVMNQDEENINVTLSTTIQGKSRLYNGGTTEIALISLAKDLPENWCIKSCLSCRYGHFCPVGNYDNELFCVTDFEPKVPRDLWHVTEDDDERKNRSHNLFECCELYKEQSSDYFTYSDYYFEINGVKRRDNIYKKC